MIKSKKGVESFPFFLFLVLLITAFVITISFYQIEIFSSFTNQKTMSDNYNRLINTMETLQTTSDKGSFRSITFEISEGYTLTFSSENDTITISNHQTLVNEVNFDILNLSDRRGNLKEELTLTSGIYEIVIYYGETSTQTEKYEIFFV